MHIAGTCNSTCSLQRRSNATQCSARQAYLVFPRPGIVAVCLFEVQETDGEIYDPRESQDKRCGAK